MNQDAPKRKYSTCLLIGLLRVPFLTFLLDEVVDLMYDGLGSSTEGELGLVALAAAEAAAASDSLEILLVIA